MGDGGGTYLMMGGRTNDGMIDQPGEMGRMINWDERRGGGKVSSWGDGVDRHRLID